MPERFYQEEITAASTSTYGRPIWPAIWAGTFTFIAIWSIFGLLGEAIFASSANPSAAHPVTGMGVGWGIWTVILTIIAMYFAGRATGHLARVTNRISGIYHGMIMFGLSVTAAIMITVLAETALVPAPAAQMLAGAHSGYLLGIFAGLGWIGFVSLFLGWLAAMAGAVAGVPRRTQTVQQEEVRRAA